MEKFILPPSPNWHLSNILACNDNGLIAFGSRSDVVIIDLKSGRKFDVSFLYKAHKDKLNVVVFSPIQGSFKNCIATCGDDGMVRIWNFKEARILYCHSSHKDGLRVTGLDWSRVDTNRVVSVNDLGSMVIWDLASNTIRKLLCGIKMMPLCLACCPHNADLIAVGCKAGVILVIDIKGTGRIVQRLRGNDQDVISLSWCPVPYNVINPKRIVDKKAGGDTQSEESENPQELLLASGGTDRFIYIWRATTDGRFEVALNLPNNALNSALQRPMRRGLAKNSVVQWACVRWVDAYTLLSTSLFGELLSWNLRKLSMNKSESKKFQPRLLHSRHYKGCFSIACPIIYDVVDNSEADSRLVWTTAMDKHVIAASVTSGAVTLDITTCGGAIFAMALSPLDPNRLAIGSSDNKVFVWNLSDISAININTYWRKIVGKVMALCWHPTEENLLAYGTGDGHIGLLDVGSNKMPTLLRLHHRKAVYRLIWAPPVLPIQAESEKSDQVVLYSVADGDIWQYTANPEEPDEEPKSLNKAVLNQIDKDQGVSESLPRSEVVFKPDNTSLAVASDQGSIYVMSFSTLALQHVILYAHKKCVNHLEWHPETVASENSVSPYKDWLASASDNIKVYNIPQEGTVELVATLSGHSEKVVSLAWSPHFNGRLLSAAYDYSVQVWDVPNQVCMGMYLAHNMAVICALFSPMDSDTIISGSVDNTVRLLSAASLPATSIRPEKKKGRLDNAIKERETGEEAAELTMVERAIKHDRPSSPDSLGIEQTTKPHQNKGTEDYKKRQKSRTLFPTTASKLVQAEHFDVLFKRWEGLPNCCPTQPSTSGEPPSITGQEALSVSQEGIQEKVSTNVEEDVPTVSELGYLDFFGDDRAMRRLLMVEESQLKRSKHNVLAQNSALWRGDVSEMISEAIAKKRLSDWLVSIAPVAGFDMWEQACLAYADQLVECGEVSMASCYLLALHRVHDAVTLLLDYKLYREAIAIAKCRLPADDPLTKEVYNQWGTTMKQQGLTSLAAHCYLAANNVQACINTLSNAKDLKSLELAAAVARRVGQTELADRLTVECLSMCIISSNYSVAHHILDSFSQYQYWKVWVKTGELLTKIKKRNEVELFDWLEGNRPALLPLWDELKQSCPVDQTDYQKLQPHLPTNKTPEVERDMWYYVSGQLAAAFAVGWPSALSMRHTILALSAAFHFQTCHPSCLAAPYLTSMIAPTGLFDENSIFNSKNELRTATEKPLMKSLKAFVCASIVVWMKNNWEKIAKLLSVNKEPSEKKSEDASKEIKEYKMKWLPELLKNCSPDLLDTENMVFFVRKAEKIELQNVVTKENIKKTFTENKAKNNGKSQQSSTGKTKTVIEEKTEGENEDDKLNVKTTVTNKSDVKTAKALDENLNVTSKKEENSRCGENTELVQKAQNITDINTVKLAENVKTDGVEPLKVNEKSIKVEDKEGLLLNNDLHRSTSKPSNGCQKAFKPSQDIEVSNLEKSSTPSTTILSGEQDGAEVHSVKENVTPVEEPSTGDAATTNTSANQEKYLKKIKILDEIILKFESERVATPSPFIAYLGIKYVIDNLVTKQDPQLALTLQETCDQLWKKSQP